MSELPVSAAFDSKLQVFRLLDQMSGELQMARKLEQQLRADRKMLIKRFGEIARGLSLEVSQGECNASRLTALVNEMALIVANAAPGEVDPQDSFKASQTPQSSTVPIFDEGLTMSSSPDWISGLGDVHHADEASGTGRPGGNSSQESLHTAPVLVSTTALVPPGVSAVPVLSQTSVPAQEDHRACKNNEYSQHKSFSAHLAPAFMVPDYDSTTNDTMAGGFCHLIRSQVEGFSECSICLSPRRAEDCNPGFPGTWTDNASNCSKCGLSFTLIARRHHCRSCGCCVCEVCSPYRVRLTSPLPHPTKGTNPTGAHRICVDCHIHGGTFLN